MPTLLPTQQQQEAFLAPNSNMQSLSNMHFAYGARGLNIGDKFKLRALNETLVKAEQQQYQRSNNNTTANNSPAENNSTPNKTKIILHATKAAVALSQKSQFLKSTLTDVKEPRPKRVLPNLNHKKQTNLTRRRNQYFFDTRPVKEFCLHHYHILVKYRWFRVRDEVTLDGLVLNGSPLSMIKFSHTQQQNLVFTRFTPQSYTMLVTENFFLGPIKSLLIYGDKIKSSFVDYIEVTYMSNLDPKIRASSSARLCRSQQQPVGKDDFVDNDDITDKQQQSDGSLKGNLFVRCAGQMV